MLAGEKREYAYDHLRDIPVSRAKSEQIAEIAAAAVALDTLRSGCLNPPTATDDELRQRTLTNLYNDPPSWLTQAHVATRVGCNASEVQDCRCCVLDGQVVGNEVEPRANASRAEVSQASIDVSLRLAERFADAAVGEHGGMSAAAHSLLRATLMTLPLSGRLPTILKTIERFDQVCMRWVVAHRRGKLDPVFVIGSHSGQLGIPWAALVLALRFGSSTGGRILPPRGLMIIFGSWATAHALKRTNNRSRPCQNHDAVPLIKCPKSSSLPSDEAASAFAGAVYTSLAIPQLTLPTPRRSNLHSGIPRVRRRPLSDRRRLRSTARSGYSPFHWLVREFAVATNEPPVILLP